MNKLSGFGILAGVGLILANQCIYTVNPGERVNHTLFTQALILDNVWGLKQTFYNPGYRLKIPFIQVPHHLCTESYYL